MPTIFERISSALATNDVAVRVTVQGGALTNLATTVAELIQHPPNELGDLRAALQALPLPHLAISSDFAQTLAALAGAIPTDLSPITGGLTDSLGALTGQLGGLTEPLGEVLEVVLAIYAATQVDLFCTQTSSPGSGGTEGAPSSATTPVPVQQLNSILDLFPQPLTLASLLDWLYLVLRNLNLSESPIVQVPILDDLRDPLVTLITWRNAMNTAELLGHLRQTLELLDNTIASSVDAVFTPIETALTAVHSQLPTATLSQVADDLAVHLGALRTAVLSSDLSTTAPAVAALNTLLDSYAVVQLTVQNNLALHFATLDDRLATLDIDLDDQIGRLVSLLQPESLLSFIPVPTASTLNVTGLGDLESWLNTLVDWLSELANRLDLTAIQGPLNTIAGTLQQAVDGLDAAMITVTLQVQSLFGEVEVLLNQVDPAALLNEVQAAIDAFHTTLAQQLQGLFAPVRDAISTVITQIGHGVESFAPADIVDALHDAIDKLTGVLKHPEVLAAMNAIRDAIEDTAQALEAVSFAPLTDQVIAEIDKLTAAFQALDTSQLSTPVQLSLQAALAILPSDLTPIADALSARLEQAIVTGPLSLLQTVQQQPQILLNQVRAFEPGTLLGSAISTPYHNLLAQMNAFKPSALLNLAATELETLKARLQASANPGQLLAPLVPLFTSLLSAFDQLRPETVTAPLQTALQEAIGVVVQALPIDATFAQLDAVLQAVEQATHLGTDTVSLLQRIVNTLSGLAHPRAQMDAWMDAVLTNVNNIDDASPLQPVFDAIDTALDKTTVAGLTGRFETSALQEALNALNPQTRLVKLIQAYNGVPRAQLAALPSSPEKTAMLAVLDRFNPVDAAFARPYQAATALHTALADAHTRLAALLLDWDSRYHEAGPLVALRHLQATPTNLRAWIGEALEDKAGRPIVAVLSLATPLAQVLGACVSKLQALVTTLTGKLTVLLQGPGSLDAIRTMIQALLDKLQHFNLDFLTQSLGEVFANLRSKLEALNPAALRGAIEAAFGAMLATLRLNLLIPAVQIAQLDTAYESIVDDLKALDPTQVVVQVVQPAFEAKILPLLDVFDPTQVLQALYDRLAGIEAELRAEIARVNEVYQKLRESIPSLNISIDVGVDLPF
jgi:hypothetical protein